MNKDRQKELSRWLKQQSTVSRKWLALSRLLGIINGLLIVAQAWLLSSIIHCSIIVNASKKILLLLLAVVFVFRSIVLWFREQTGFCAGKYIRKAIRKRVLDRLQQAGPSLIQLRSVGSVVTLVLEQIDDIQDYYSRYLPQVTLSFLIPSIIIIAVFFTNWTAPLILLATAPLIPIFMIIIGESAADANQRNFLALERLSGYFLDRLRGIETLRFFGRGKIETENIRKASQDFRQRTMEVLRLAFLSSGVLEFFSSLSIALIAIYFGFSYLGEFDFGYYRSDMTLSSGFFTLILATEFFQPLRDLGTFYHAKAQAVGAADNLQTFLETPLETCPRYGNIILDINNSITLEANKLYILSPKGETLAGPLNFTILPGQRVAVVGRSGSGKSSLLHTLSGFLSYAGSLRINGIEFRDLDLDEWRKMLSWVGQNPQLPVTTLRENILLANPDTDKTTLQSSLERARVSEFLPLLPNGIDTVIGDQGIGLSVGQAQRVAVARALLNPCKLLLLDEPVANLDVHSERCVMDALNDASMLQSTLMVTHQLDNIAEWDSIWVMENGRIVEKGDYNSLCTQKGVFFTMLSSRREDI